MLDVNYFDELRIGLATADQIRMWSNGEVKKPETINYRTLKPEKDGLFDERIFGPTKDWECYCGKYKRVRFKGIICERCGVEVTRAKVRRERMGHIELAAPVTHIWYFKGVPSRLGYLLDLAPKELEKVIYFAAYLITHVDEAKRSRDLATLETAIRKEIEQVETDAETRRNRYAEELEAKLADLESKGEKAATLNRARKDTERAIKELDARRERDVALLEQTWNTFRSLSPRQLVDNEIIWRELRDRFGDYFRGGMGAEAVKELLHGLNLREEEESLKETVRSGKGQRKARAIKRLKVISPFTTEGGKNSPMGMVLDAVPVIPPDLRPMVQLDGGRFATSDLNDLYRRVINRNNRLKRLLDLGAPEIIVNNEKRMLQEAVDALFDNGRRGRPVTGPGNRPLKSLSDMLKGKQGRFRQNLLGKRVDYSGRSVIVVGPQLKLHQCGLPKVMALELFKPFVMKRLVDAGIAQNIKSAKRMVERARPHVWDILEEVIRDHPVMLNRAPTLHRLGIQAFEPILVEGKAIKIHPLVCAAFNADFDGDQMAVHVPLSAEAQAEARLLMLSTNNILSPAHGTPIVTPTQDMILGTYYLTMDPYGRALARTHEGKPKRAFASVAEALLAYDFHTVVLQEPVLVRLKGKLGPGETLEETEATAAVPANEDDEDAEGGPRAMPLIETTVGRLIFNEAMPGDFPYVNRVVGKRELNQILENLSERYDKVDIARTLDAIKGIGFHYATKAGVTIGVTDATPAPRKPAILAEYERQADKVETQYRRGIITDDERRQELIEIWTKATDEVKEDMEHAFRSQDLNPIYMMANSGARGNIMQVRQIAGMRGLVANPRGEIIPRPIKANFREGLTVLEYFISTHGARKGLADTALRTADSGYLTRRLVDVSQELIVREIDCGTERGIPVYVTVTHPISGLRVEGPSLDTKLFGRTSLETVTGADGEVIVTAGEQVDRPKERRLAAEGIDSIRVRSVLTCDAKYGVCLMCYGRNMATGALVDIGEAVGIIAAQSIGEPGTQLTMRTFHTGGVAGEDITHGLPRVVELFEARTPKGKATIAKIPGRVEIEEAETKKIVRVVGEDGREEEYPVSRRQRLRVDNGDLVEPGDQITEGSIDPHDMLEVGGIRAVQLYLVQEVQQVYKSQGVPIHDKHIELIVRQMLRKVSVIEPGDTEFLPGDLADRKLFEAANQEVMASGGEPATARPILMGITKSSLATESWLSAASFQETTRVLTDAAIKGKSDSLLGLKENVIIGKLIPAGTGMTRYRSIQVTPAAEVAQLLELLRREDEERRAQREAEMANRPVYDEEEEVSF
ncbi:MAG TPA: DNA-directed RNA polymerase subunit beta' [Actinomycetota bacterium]|nr:DNA-directed RNA polymerase subunit beta' [Actinomycetota bacterium]